MSVYFCADPHLSHRRIHRFRDVDTCEQNTELFKKEGRNKLHKRSVTYFLGDVAFDQEGLDAIAALPGRKILIKGNHDNLVSTAAQLDVFEEIHGCIKYKEFFLSHAPVHPQQLFKLTNVHGHVHHMTVKTWWGGRDKRYINMCPDVQKQYFISLEEARKQNQ